MATARALRRRVPLLLLLALLAAVAGPARAAPPEAQRQAEASPSGLAWSHRDAAGETVIELHLFWTPSCPHCRRALAFAEQHVAPLPWVSLRAIELTSEGGALESYLAMAGAVGFDPRFVPTFVFCGTARQGFDDAAHGGAALLAALRACRDREAAAAPPAAAAPEPPPLELPWLGELRPEALSLPLLTVLLGGLDAFNPCAFFVLLLLLGLMLHARDRRRMLLVGVLFVATSGAVYFAFMAAWLNLFVLIGHLRAVTLAAGALAVALGLANLADALLGRRASLAIPEGTKPRLYARMRGLLAARRLPAVVAGTLVLALAANGYELLCTAGFPMVYTRALTLQEVSGGACYLYLAAYNLVYVTPLLAIVLLFATALGGRRLGERGGRLLKLLSGLMMLELGLVLALRPALLDSPATALGLVAAALAATALAAVALPRQRDSGP